MFLLCQRKTPRSVVPTKGRQGDWHDLAEGHTGNGANGKVPYAAISCPECPGLGYRSVHSAADPRPPITVLRRIASAPLNTPASAGAVGTSITPPLSA
jgi:hypothetical protein